MDDRDPALDETLRALGMPPDVAARWLRDLARFCERHGGRRRYRAMLALFDDCLARLPDESGERR